MVSNAQENDCSERNHEMEVIAHFGVQVVASEVRTQGCSVASTNYLRILTHAGHTPIERYHGQEDAFPDTSEGGLGSTYVPNDENTTSVV